MAGTLDPYFGAAGVLEMPERAKAIVSLPEKKLLVATGSDPFAPHTVIRLTEAGKYDGSFGDGGVVEIPVKGGIAIFPQKAIALQNGGYLISGGQKLSKNQLHVFRLAENGQLDTAFGDNGVATLSVVDEEATGEIFLINNTWMAVAARSEKIYLSATFAFASRIKGVVFRLNEDGSQDMDFNGGQVLIEEGGTRVALGALEVQGDDVLVGGTIFAPGANEGDAFVARYSQSGSIDTAFGDRGRVVILSNSNVRRSFLTSVVSGRDGMIVVSGRSSNDGVKEGLLTVLNASGSFNRVFNNGAPLYSAFLEQMDFEECALQENGKIVVTGRCEGNYLMVARYDLDGSMDRTFGGEGWAVFRDKAGFIHNEGLLTEDNKIVVFGSQSLRPFAVRYLG
jgi:uncharacterized delta-60 repeat protein